MKVNLPTLELPLARTRRVGVVRVWLRYGNRPLQLQFPPSVFPAVPAFVALICICELTRSRR
jgi:hypothetical protein